MLEEMKEELVTIGILYDGELTKETSLREDLGLDSLDAMELVTRLESRYEISISDDSAELSETIGDLIRIVEKLK